MWKFIPWTSSQTVGKSDSTAGTQLDKRSLVVLEMDISELLVPSLPCAHYLNNFCADDNHFMLFSIF